MGREGGVEVAAGDSDGEWPGFVLKVACNNDVGVFWCAVDDGRSIAAVCARGVACHHTAGRYEIGEMFHREIFRSVAYGALL